MINLIINVLNIVPFIRVTDYIFGIYRKTYLIRNYSKKVGSQNGYPHSAITTNLLLFFYYNMEYFVFL